MQSAKNMVRVGLVSDFDAARCAVRVVFPDLDDLVSNWLPVVVPQTLGSQDYSLPAVDESVVCVFLGNGLEVGFCLGSYYATTNSPPSATPDDRGIWFPDGSHVRFDKSTGTLEVQAVGRVDITAPNVTINGNLAVSGSITRGGEPL